MFEFPFLGEIITLNAEERATLPGQFIELPDGIVHYEMAGPSDGQLVVLVHGFSVPYLIWDPTYPSLAEAGFRVLRYDLYGRGYSDRPLVRYDTDLFDRQLIHLLDNLHIQGPINLVGLSMGGVVVVNFTSRHPERVRKIALVDPGGFKHKLSRAFKCMLIPGLGEVLYSLKGTQILLKFMEKGSHNIDNKEQFLDQCLQQMKYKGYKRAILSTARTGMPWDALDAYRRVGEQGTPVLLIWGREDQTVSIENSQKVLQAVPQVQFHMIEDVGHIPHYECPEIVNPLLINYFRD